MSRAVRSLHPAWFAHEPGKQPNVGDVTESIHRLANQLDALGMMLFNQDADSGLCNEDVYKRAGDMLMNYSSEIEALIEQAGPAVKASVARLKVAS